MIIKHSFLLLLISFFAHTFTAQVQNIKRIEFELKEGYSNHEFAKFGDNGILLYSKSDELVEGVYEWKIERYSTDLELSETTFIKVPKGQRLDETFENETNLYLFFKSKKGAYNIFEVNAKTLEIRKSQGILPKKIWLKEFRVIQNTAFLTGSIKGEPTIYTINFQTGEKNLRPILVNGYKSNKLSIENVQIQDQTNELFVYMNAYLKKEHDIHILRFDSNGEKKDALNLTADIDQKLSSISASYISDNEYVYTGTYSDRSSRSSQGVYICKSTNGKKDFIQFYNFLEFEKFLSYLPEKRQAKIEKKKKKKEKKGKELKLNYQIASHNIIIKDDKYIFIGEAYYPTYRTETYTTTGANGTTVTHTRTVFDGYRYTHATVAAFDKKGARLWDQTFEMFPSYKPFYVKKFISVSTDSKNKIDLLFSSRSSIHSISFSENGEIINDDNYDLIETGSEDDKVRYSLSNMDHWYGSYFLTHGLQKIKNKEEKEKRGKKKRKVYFINKISYK